MTIANSAGQTLLHEFDIHVVADTQAPVVVVQTNPTRAAIGTSVTVAVNATDNVGVASLTLTAQLADGSTVPVTLQPNHTATLTYTTPGPVTFTAHAADSAGNVGTGTTTLTVFDPSNTGDPTGNLELAGSIANVNAALNGLSFTPANALVPQTVTVTAAAGSAQGLYLIVSDVEAARKDLVARGIEVSEVFHPATPGAQFRIDGSGRINGPAANHATYNSFATFRDPDGNGWLFQEITTRLPGRGLGNLDVATLTELLQEAEKHHSVYEPTAPKHPWSSFYAAYIVARQEGKTPEEAAEDGKIHVEGAR